jgi:chemotaxis protein MotB
MKGTRKTNQGIGNESDSNAWMVTFGDLIMLLLTFFVLLLSMKSMDTKEIEKKFKFFSNEEGPLEYTETRISGEAADRIGKKQKTIFIENTKLLKQALALMEGIVTSSERDIEKKELKNILSITQEQRGVVITIQSDELFESGKAEIKTDRFYILDAAGNLLKNASNEILIMGHTDNVPYRGDMFSSNHELSFFRALNVFDYLTERSALNPGQLATGGYGDRIAKYSNDTPENRAKNRRIELILRKVYYSS